MSTTAERPRASLVRDESGAVLVEFAMILVVLLLLVFGIVDFGRVLYAANNLQSAAREGARLAAVMANPPAGVGAIKDTVIARSFMLGGARVASSDIAVTFDYSSGTPALLQATTVQVTYPVVLVTPIRAFIGRDAIPLSVAVKFRWEYGS